MTTARVLLLALLFTLVACPASTWPWDTYQPCVAPPQLDFDAGGDR